MLFRTEHGMVNVTSLLPISLLFSQFPKRKRHFNYDILSTIYEN